MRDIVRHAGKTWAGRIIFRSASLKLTISSDLWKQLGQAEMLQVTVERPLR